MRTLRGFVAHLPRAQVPGTITPRNDTFLVYRCEGVSPKPRSVPISKGHIVNEEIASSQRTLLAMTYVR